jgi:hypothetical protein
MWIYQPIRRCVYVQAKIRPLSSMKSATRLDDFRFGSYNSCVVDIDNLVIQCLVNNIVCVYCFSGQELNFRAGFPVPEGNIIFSEQSLRVEQ